MGLLVQDAIEYQCGGVAREWQTACRHPIQDRAEGKEIRARIQGLAPRLLRGHVGKGADSRPWTR
jgi:hypothetical protein